MKERLISIIIPCYNSEEFIEELINMLKKQTYKSLEIILIDDGSTDNTFSVIEKNIKNDYRFKLLKQHNSGVAKTRNRGIKESTGDNILFMDSDDIIAETYIENFIKCIKYPNEIISCQIKRFESISKIYPINYSDLEILKLNDNRKIVRYFYPFHNIKYFGSVVNKCYPRELIVNNQIYFSEDLSVGEDLFFNLDILNVVNKWTVINNQYYDYRVNHNSLTFSYKNNYLDMRIKIIDKLRVTFIKNDLDESPLYEEYIKAAYSQLMLLYYTKNNLRKNEKYYIFTTVKTIIFDKVNQSNFNDNSIKNRMLFELLKLPNFILSQIIIILSRIWLLKMKKSI